MRADSRAGRIIGALARTPTPPPAPSNFGVPRESFVGRAIRALARTPEVTPTDYANTGKDAAERDSLPRQRTNVHESASFSPPADNDRMSAGSADAAEIRLSRVQSDDAAQIVEMRLIARDLIRALGKVFGIAHTLSDLTGITPDIGAVAEAAQNLAQALNTVVALIKELDRAGTGELTRAFSKVNDFNFANVLAIAHTLRDTKDRVSELARIIDNVRLLRAPIDADNWDLTRVLERLSTVPADVAEVVRSVDNRGFTDSGLSGIDYLENILSIASGQLREVARSAVNLADELDSASNVAKRLASAQQELADVPTELLEFAARLAQEFDTRELSRAHAMASAMSELLHTLNDISASASILARARSMNDALKARGLVSRLANLEMILNFVRTRNIKRRAGDSISRAFGQIIRLAVTPIDASSADLRQLNLDDLDDLEGIIWTPDTKWPARIFGEVRARSDEIRPQVYRVRSGNERDPLDLAVGV